MTTIISSGHAFLEGPRWHDGDLYASDFFKHSVLRWPGGEGPPEPVVEAPRQSSGLGWNPAGELLVVSMLDRKLTKAVDGRLVEVAKLGDRATWHSNDMVVDTKGRAYIGNFGWDEATDPVIKSTVLQLVDTDGTARVVAEDLICPNGMAISPDGRTLYVNESFAARVSAFDIDQADGSLSNRRVWASFSDREFKEVPEALASGAILPDGMALDAEGAIWVADCHGQGVHRVVEGGEVVDFISTAPHAVFACALGGPERRTLFMCCTFRYGDGNPMEQHEGTLRRAEVAIPGAGLP